MKNSPFYSLVLVIPAYNEAACIEKVVSSWLYYLNNQSDLDTTFKLIVVNDGSTDRTGEILNAIAAKEACVSVIHQSNAGHGNTVYNGYKTALKLDPDFVFQVDSDDQFVPEDFDKLWSKRHQSPFITGYRKHRHDDYSRLIITRILRLVIGMIFQCRLIDSNIPYRLIRGNYLAELINKIPDNCFAPNIFLSVMAKREGHNLFEIPIGHNERKTGTVSIVKWKLLKVCALSLFELIQFRIRLIGLPKSPSKLNPLKNDFLNEV